jgi:hypothetical protein
MRGVKAPLLFCVGGGDIISIFYGGSGGGMGNAMNEMLPMLLLLQVGEGSQELKPLPE